MEGKPNQLYAQGMRSFEQYDETRVSISLKGSKRTTMLMRFKNNYNCMI